MTSRILSYEEFEKEMEAAFARAKAADLLTDNSDERFEMLVERMQAVFDYSDTFMVDGTESFRTRDNVNRNMGEAEARVPYREPRSSLVNFDWTVVTPVPKVVVNKGPTPRKVVPRKARDYYCGVQAMFCDDLKETIHSIVGHDINLSFLDVDETDDLFNRML